MFPPAGPLSHGYLTALAVPQTAPGLNLTQVLNAFSQQPGPVAPGEIVALSVAGLAPEQPLDLGLVPQDPLTTTLAGVTVLFDGHPAYLTAVIRGRIVCIVPQAVAGQATTAIQVLMRDGASNVLNAQVAPAAVGVLSLDRSGSGMAEARNADGTLNSPSNPAAIGSQVTIFFTGGGVTNPPEVDGVLPTTEDLVPVAHPPIFPSGGRIFSLPGFDIVLVLLGIWSEQTFNPLALRSVEIERAASEEHDSRNLAIPTASVRAVIASIAFAQNIRSVIRLKTAA